MSEGMGEGGLVIDMNVGDARKIGDNIVVKRIKSTSKGKTRMLIIAPRKVKIREVPRIEGTEP